MRNKYKKSIDFDQDAYESLEQYVQAQGYKSASQVVNTLVRNFCNLSMKTRHELSEYCSARQLELNAYMGNSSDIYHRDEALEDADKYASLARYFSDYRNSLQYFESSESGMKVTYLQDGFGYAVYPDTWIPINEKEATDCQDAFVFEAMNGELYGVGHYIYFTQSSELTDEIIGDLFSYVKLHSRKAADAFDNHLYTKSAFYNGQFSHERLMEWKKSFVPCVYKLAEYDAHSITTRYPYGARIHRPYVSSVE